MARTLRYSARCPECGEWFPEFEDQLADFLDFVFFNPSPIFDILGEREDLTCAKCGAEFPQEKGDRRDEDLGRLFDSIARPDKPCAPQIWPELRDRVFVLAWLPNGLPSRFKTEKGVEYEVRKVHCCHLDRSGLPDDAPVFPRHPFGHYHLETDKGEVLLECRPLRREDETPDFDAQEWYLVGVVLSPTEKEGRQRGLAPDRAKLALLETSAKNLEAYQTLYEVETHLRWFVHEVMRARHGDRWWEDEQFWRGMADKSGIRNVRDAFQKAAERQEEEHQQPYVIMRSADLFAYLELRNLREVMETFSGDFSALVPKQGILFGMLESLETIRNALAHNRPLSQEALMEVRKARGIVRTLVTKAERT